MRKMSCVFLLFILPSIALSQDDGETASQEIRNQVIEQEEVQETLKKEKESASSNLKIIKEDTASAERRVEVADSETEKALAEYLLSLQDYRKKISETKLNRILAIDEKTKSMKVKTEMLKSIDQKRSKGEQHIGEKDLEKATAIWREIVDETSTNVFSEKFLGVENPPDLPPGFDLRGESYGDIKKKIRSVYEEAENEKKEVEQVVASLKKSQREISGRLLLNSGRVRSMVMENLIERGRYSEWEFDSEKLNDYARELRIVPHRFLAIFADKFLELKLMSQEGAKGWIDIGKQIVLFLFVCLLPFLIFGVFRTFSNRLEEFRRSIFTRSQMNFKKRTRMALFIGRVNPYLPWLFALVTVEIAYALLQDTLLEPLTLLLPYLRIYILYRGFLILFSSVLAKILLSKSLDSLRIKQAEVKATASRLSILFFTEWALLHVVQDSVRQALIYNLVFDIIIYFNIAFIAIESRGWKVQLLDLGERWLPKGIKNFLARSSSRIVDYFVCPLLFLGNILFLALNWCFQFLGKFDFGKQVLSELFKKRLEVATKEDEERKEKRLDEEYEMLFSAETPISPKTRVSLSRTPFNQCVNSIEKWHKGQSTEDLILLYGNLGIGKSTLLSALESKFGESLLVRRVRTDGKVTTREGLFKILSETLGCNLESASDLEEQDKKLDKTILLIDDVHNFYLNTLEGLEAYRTLIELTSLQLENLFWCLSCNERALAHLSGLFGENHFSGTRIELMSWTDSEIHELILKRHRLSNYRLKFDQVISAVHKGDILESSSGVEIQFFRLLWGQSRGNPSTAQELWLTSATKESSETIRIAVPEFTNTKTLADLDDEVLVIYAAIVKHESLSFEEIMDICKVPSGVVRKAIKFGEDGMILDQLCSQRWQIHPKAQYVVHAQLLGRNLIYG